MYKSKKKKPIVDRIWFWHLNMMQNVLFYNFLGLFLL